MRNAGDASCSLELENTWRRRKRQSLPMMISLPSHHLWLFQSTLMLQLNIAELKLKKLSFAGMLLKPPPNPSLVFKIESPTTLKARGIAPIKSCLRIGAAEKLVLEFDPKVPIEKALTPPSSWYTDPSFYALELERVFCRGWQAVGYSEQVKEAHEYFAGRMGNVEYVVCRDDNGQIVAFHNVCRHHGSVLASGTGKKSCFVCPYHGWTYGLDGALRKATRITGIENFNVNEFGLIPIASATWGPFVLLNFERQISPKQVCDSDAVAREWLGSCSETFHSNGVDSSLAYVCRREYVIECNWKVFCDNYLDGGYHVPYAHKGLASGLNLDSYSTTIFEKVSIQGCAGGSADNEDDFARLGSKAFYAFVYPNFMINRYGPWMDTNLVIPLGPRKCLIVFDYFLEASLKDDKEFIERSLRDSERVQMEDVSLCESVQRGIESMAYNCGRYAPGVEEPMHHFHRLLFHDLTTTT